MWCALPPIANRVPRTTYLTLLDVAVTVRKTEKMPAPNSDNPPIKLDPPETVRSIAKRLEDAGFETWCVGGAVRDALLGHAHLDWDLATAAKPPEVRHLFKRTVPVGIEFGTIGVLDHDNVIHLVTTFPKALIPHGRHAV